MNPVLQMLHYVPELRSRVMSHTCEREFCLTCGVVIFKSHVEYVSDGFGVSTTQFPSSGLQVREAAALGLIEGNGGELEARSEKSPAKRIQAFRDLY